MLQNLAKTIQTAVTDAYSSLTSVNDRTGPTKTTTTVEQTPYHKINESKEALLRSKRKANSMSAKPEAKPYTNSIARFLDRVDAAEEIDAPESQSESRSADSQSQIPRRVHRHSDRSEERRLLGIPEKSPPDAVKIAMPTHKNHFTRAAGFQPRDTLNHPRSDKGRFFFEQTKDKRTPLLIEPEARTGHKKTKEYVVHENNHERPNKRARTGPSPVKGSSKFHAISIDDSQDVGSVTLSDAAPRTPKTHIGGLQRTPGLSDIMRPKTHAITTQSVERCDFPTQSTQTLASYTPDSPDELLLDEDGDSNFMKRARRERMEREASDGQGRQSNGLFGRTKEEFDVMLDSPPSLHGNSKTRRNSVASGRQYKIGSKMEQRLQTGDESPDALQGECTTTDSTKRRAKTTPTTHSETPEYKRVRARKQTVTAKDREVEYRFPLLSYICRGVPTSKNMVITVEPETKKLALDFAEPHLAEEPLFRLPVKDIQSFMYSVDKGSSKVMLAIRNALHSKICLEFATQDIVQKFFNVLDLVGVAPQERNAQWMEKVFSNTPDFHAKQSETEARRRKQFRSAEHQLHSPRPTSTTTKSSLSSPSGQAGVKKTRLIDQLDSPTGMTIISGSDRSGPGLDTDFEKGSKVVSKKVSPTRQDMDGNTRSVGALTRTTRSQASKTGDAYDPDPPKKVSHFDTLKRWEKPLVYPRTGKKRETVQFDDLQRLDDDEFLNDNLVCLFLRYLEEHTDPEYLKKIHFFNSFLFEALTKDSKARRGINFEAVQRWTSKVDLFSRDFVVVPVNEHLHWFVMIICNLSYFKRKHGQRQEDEEEFAESELVKAINEDEEHESQVILKSDLDETNEASARSSFAEMTLDDQGSSIPSPTTGRSLGYKGRKKVKRPLQKYDVEKPIIITLDSLDQSRSATASLLKQYIVAEAKDKHQWDIDGNEIKGMTAKGIPHQYNFSDCGLYLCMYLERFVLNPYRFVRSILQRNDEAGWPKGIESSELRKRLRNLLLTLHREQYSGGDFENGIPPVGSILAQMDLPEHQENRVMDIADIRAARKRYNAQKAKLETAIPKHVSEARSDNEAAIKTLDDWKQSVNNPITVDDDSQPLDRKSPATERRSDLVSPYFSTSDNTVSTRENDPVVLAEHVRNQRSPPQSTSDNYNILEHPARVSELLASGQTCSVDQRDRDLDPSSLPVGSPTSTVDRKSHQKFKQQEQKPMTPVEIEDSDFEGFPDPVPVPQQEVLDQRSVVEGDMEQRQAKKPLLSDTTASDGYGIHVSTEPHDNTDMLV